MIICMSAHRQRGSDTIALYADHRALVYVLQIVCMLTKTQKQSLRVPGVLCPTKAAMRVKEMLQAPGSSYKIFCLVVAARPHPVQLYINSRAVRNASLWLITSRNFTWAAPAALFYCRCLYQSLLCFLQSDIDPQRDDIDRDFYEYREYSKTAKKRHAELELSRLTGACSGDQQNGPSPPPSATYTKNSEHCYALFIDLEKKQHLLLDGQDHDASEVYIDEHGRLVMTCLFEFFAKLRCQTLCDYALEDRRAIIDEIVGNGSFLGLDGKKEARCVFMAHSIMTNMITSACDFDQYWAAGRKYRLIKKR